MNIAELISLAVTVSLVMCASAIFFSVAISFIEDRPSHKVERQSKSIVETGTMLLFFVVYFLVVRNNIGYINLFNHTISLCMSVVGAIVIVLGTYVNVRGRWELGQNWANQIKIYQDHQLMIVGMYTLVRHPLYASLIWIFIAGSVVFSNVIALFLALCVFTPMMYFRAKQEESILIKAFPEAYPHYQSMVGMFFPKRKL